MDVILLLINFTFSHFYNIKTGCLIENLGIIKFELINDTLTIEGELQGDFSHYSAKTFDSQRIFNDDYIRFVLSDGTNSYSYIFNPAGTRRDELVFIDDFYTSYQWDGTWNVTSNYSDSLWKFNVKIFNWYEKKFRVQVVIHQSKTNMDYCLSICKNPVYCYKKFKEISLKNIGYTWNWRIKPYFAIKKLRSAGTSYGVDALLYKASKIKIGVTLNPDYSELESDPEMIDLEDKPIYLPEKRDFFKDDLDFMKFYTRSIRKPLWGIKFVKRSPNPSFLTFLLRDSTGVFYFYDYLKYRLFGIYNSFSSMIYETGHTRSFSLSYNTQMNPFPTVSVGGGFNLYIKNKKTGVSYNFGFGRYNNVKGLNMVITATGRDSFYLPETELLFLSYINKTMISIWYKFPFNKYSISDIQISGVTHNWFDWDFGNKRYNKNTFSIDLGFKNNWDASLFIVDEWMDWKGILKFVGASIYKITSGWDVFSFSIEKGVIVNSEFINETASFGKSFKFLNFSLDFDNYTFNNKNEFLLRFKTELQFFKWILFRSYFQTNTFTTRRTLNILVDYSKTRLKLVSGLNKISTSDSTKYIYTVKMIVKL